MTYRCNECGHIFEEGEQTVWQETHGFAEPPYETMSGCPLCQGDYDEVYPCKICGAHSEEDFCPTCKHLIKQRFQRLVAENFTAAERELLNELYDGEDI